MPILELEGVTKNFGGLRAVGDVSLKFDQGEILGLIGPNGAGKTTLFNLVTGFLEPDHGDIRFDGSSVLGRKPHEVCALGVTRTFQIVKPFAGLNVLENVMVGAFRLTANPSEARAEALGVLNSLGLSHLSDKVASSLTVSARKQMEIARAIATKPKLLLLDEPVGGLNPAEVVEMMSQVKRIRDSGITIFIIEHVMKAVMSVSDRIAVLHHGEKIAEGSPREISANRDVITAYLGEEYLAS